MKSAQHFEDVVLNALSTVEGFGNGDIRHAMEIAGQPSLGFTHHDPAPTESFLDLNAGR